MHFASELVKPSALKSLGPRSDAQRSASNPSTLDAWARSIADLPPCHDSKLDASGGHECRHRSRRQYSMAIHVGRIIIKHVRETKRHRLPRGPGRGPTKDTCSWRQNPDDGVPDAQGRCPAPTYPSPRANRVSGQRPTPAFDRHRATRGSGGRQLVYSWRGRTRSGHPRRCRGARSFLSGSSGLSARIDLRKWTGPSPPLPLRPADHRRLRLPDFPSTAS
jgi:hypothetical protein